MIGVKTRRIRKNSEAGGKDRFDRSRPAMRRETESRREGRLRQFLKRRVIDDTESRC